MKGGRSSGSPCSGHKYGVVAVLSHTGNPGAQAPATPPGLRARGGDLPPPAPCWWGRALQRRRPKARRRPRRRPKREASVDTDPKARRVSHRPREAVNWCVDPERRPPSSPGASGSLRSVLVSTLSVRLLPLPAPRSPAAQAAAPLQWRLGLGWDYSGRGWGMVGVAVRGGESRGPHVPQRGAWSPEATGSFPGVATRPDASVWAYT